MLIWIMVFNATFNNISAISWRTVLLVEEILIVTLRGIALQEDKFQKEREQLEVFI
jgi:steroid 5-alpha reductase family enzyme